jgi:hypothetical protein
MTQTALAKALGVSSAMVSIHKRRGMPVDSLEAATEWRRANLNPMHTHPAPGEKPRARNPLERPVLTIAADGDASDGPVSATGSDYQSARTAREIFAAELARIEYETSVGRLVPAAEVRAEFAKQTAQVRDQFLRLPDRLAPVLVGLGDIDTIKRLIMAEVRTALTQFGGVA